MVCLSTGKISNSRSGLSFLSLFRASGRLGEQPSFLRHYSEHVWKHVSCFVGSSVLEPKCETLCARVCLVCLGKNRLPRPPLPGLEVFIGLVNTPVDSVGHSGRVYSRCERLPSAFLAVVVEALGAAVGCGRCCPPSCP